MNNQTLIERVMILACVAFFFSGMILLGMSVFHDDNDGHTAQVTIAHFGGIAGDNDIVSIFLSIFAMVASLIMMLKISKRMSFADMATEGTHHVSRWGRKPTEIGKQIARLMRKKDGSSE